MNPFYQHPYFDIFKAMSSTKWKDAHKEGDTKEDFDKQLSKQIVRIGGATSASNYL